jgi:PilZ domain-containing protein
MGKNSNSSVSAVARRRSQRVLMQVSVRIRGEDSLGKPVEEETETLAINAHGALVLLKARLTSGSKVFLQHKRTQEEQECHVAFLGPVRSGKAEIGLEFSAPRPSFWRVAFPPEDWTPRHPEARTVASNRAPKTQE